MYNAFFGFRKAPFASTTDPDFFFRSNQHDAALKGLLLSVEARMGLVTLVGSEGTGKTVVLECLRNSLGPDIPCVFIRDSRISLKQYFEKVTSHLNLDLRFVIKSDAQIFLALTRFAIQQAQSGRTVVLMIDEAHNLPADVFYETVHFASLLHDKVKAIQTIFAGRPELQPRLAELNPNRIGQRALLSRSLYPFTAQETQEYIEFRLTSAGMPRQTVFPRRALEEIYQRSQGFAPAIHALCDQLLRTAFSSTSKVCTREICDQVFKKPPTRLTQMPVDARTVVGAEIDSSRLASPPMPEPPPMQTVLLRVAVDARPGSRRPRLASMDERPVHLAGIRAPMAFPKARFELAGTEWALRPILPMLIEDCTKASIFSLSKGFDSAISSLPVTGFSLHLSQVGAAQDLWPSGQLPASELIAPECYVSLGPSVIGMSAPRGPFPEPFSPALQSILPREGLSLASVIPYSHVPLAPLRGTGHAPQPSAFRLNEMEPANLIPDGRPATTALDASLHPNVEGPTTLLPLALSVQPTPPLWVTPVSPYLTMQRFLQPRRPFLLLKPADPSIPSRHSRPTWIPRIASRKIPWVSRAETPAGALQGLVSHRKSLLALVIPILAALALYSALPEMRVAADKSRQGWQWAQRAVLNRAAVAFDEDFRSGLGDWTNRGGSPPSWTSDQSGFVRPGALALYRPALGLVDYQMQFLGTIDNKGLSWVARASDFNNYYAIRLTVLKPGPLPSIGVTRYAVIHGIPQKQSTIPLLMRAQADTVYRVRLDMQGDHFVLSIQDQPVDSWSEHRLGRGSIGFFSEKDAGSRIASLQVRGHYDMLGRLCAFLMPPRMTNSR